MRRARVMFGRQWMAAVLPLAGMRSAPYDDCQPNARCFLAERRCMLFPALQQHLAAVTAPMKLPASVATAVAATATATVLPTRSTQMHLPLGAAVARNAKERFAAQHVAITQTQAANAEMDGATATNMAARQRRTFCSVRKMMKGRLGNPVWTRCACPCVVATQMGQRATNRAAR